MRSSGVVTNGTISDLLASAVAGAAASSLPSPLVDKKGLAAILDEFVQSSKFDTDLKSLVDASKADKATGDGKFAALEATTAALQATMLEQIKMPVVEAEFAEFKGAGGLSGLARIRQFTSPGRCVLPHVQSRPTCSPCGHTKCCAPLSP